MVRKIGKRVATLFVAANMVMGLQLALSANNDHIVLMHSNMRLFFASLAQNLLFFNFARMFVVLVYDLLTYYFPDYFCRLTIGFFK